jgi:flavin reductase (DIM6/NTAB) family NADH-FMN oxidoreductase RutF
MGEVLPMSTSIFNLTNPEIYVITAAHEGQVSGQVATWVTLAALVPERLRVVTILSPRNFTFGLVRESKRFVLHLLAQGQQDWLPLFGLYSMREVDKFAGIAIAKTADGIPIVPDTCGWAECQIVQEVDLGDRVIFIADVVHHQVFAERKPLCRIEAMAGLPPEVVRELATKRLEDIECDRGLMGSFHAIQRDRCKNLRTIG